MRIRIDSLDRQTNEDLVREYFKHENEDAVDVAEILSDLHQLNIVIARSTMHNILMLLMDELFIVRKKIGNRYLYYRYHRKRL